MVILALDISGGATGYAIGRRQKNRKLWKIYRKNTQR